MELGQRPAAEQAFRGALEIREQLVAEFPAVPSYRGELAESLNGLGVLLHVLGQWPAAEQACQRALEIREKLVADFPSVPQYRRELAGSAVNFGNFLEDQEKPEASLVWFARAIALLAPLVEREPRLITERLFLRNAHLGRATALDRLARHVDAVKDWDRALALCAEPTVKQYLGCARLRSLARAGEHARAVADANALAAGKGVTGGNLYDLAGVCALAAAAVKEDARLQDRYAARAVELLRQAVARGYQDVERLNKDRDLDALRQREDFRRLLAELEAGKPPQRK
jgi:tetratricopeptide (TPR) repeat protein